MHCAACGTENRADRKFCAQCGATLARACPACGAANLPGERFCGECGRSLEVQVSSLPGGDEAGQAPPTNTSDTTAPGASERRLVSVLFADLVGSTAMAEGRDPEAVREVLATYFTTARAVIERYGGTVEKFIGDAVMAVWGAPTAHEDDAERAVRAGLDLVDAVAGLRGRTGVPDLAARAAVLTGEAAVTLGAQGHGLVAGDLVNGAARLQGVATPGTVLVGEATEGATRDAIVFEPAGEHVVKGKAVPIAAWRAMRVVAGRRGAGRADRLEAPFVGRATELRALKDALAATGAERRARYVAITGQAGIGKSRLAWELEKHVDGLVESVYWHRGRSPAYGEGIAYWALGEMVRSRVGLLETDPAGVASAKLALALETYVADAEDRRWIEPHLRVLLGLEGPTGGDRSEQFGAWRRFFEAISAKGTTVLAFEDLQWADDGLLDFIDSLFEWSRSQPILVIVLARPELLERRPGLGAASRNAVTLHLEPLEPAAIRELLAGLAPELAPSLVDAVVARAEGIPLYAIELVRMLRDGGMEAPSASADKLADPTIASGARRGPPRLAAAGRPLPAPGRGGPGSELHHPGAGGRERRGPGDARGAPTGPRPAGVPVAGGGSAFAGAWAVRVRAIGCARGGVRHARTPRPAVTSSRGGPLRRLARRRVDGDRGRRRTTSRRTGPLPMTSRVASSGPRPASRCGARPSGPHGCTTTSRRSATWNVPWS